MKPFLEKLNLAENQSFYTKTHSTPLFEVGWHQHSEMEIIYFKEGSGKAFINNYVGEFDKGDIYFVGSDIAHSFQKSIPQSFVSAVVTQFREDFWGSSFLNLPECLHIKDLLHKAQQGIKLKSSAATEKIRKTIERLEDAKGVGRLLNLIQCLQLINEHNEIELLAAAEVCKSDVRHQERINMVYRYTLDNYFEPITLEQISEVASMSIPAFCSYFKRSTRKTYIEFLTEVRIEQACKLLIDSDKSINEIGFNSGFNTLPNFNKQFFKVKKMTPSQYRKLYRHHLATG